MQEERNPESATLSSLLQKIEENVICTSRTPTPSPIASDIEAIEEAQLD